MDRVLGLNFLTLGKEVELSPRSLNLTYNSKDQDKSCKSKYPVLSFREFSREPQTDILLKIYFTILHKQGKVFNSCISTKLFRGI